jgi:UMF1 family MFS transporter
MTPRAPEPGQQPPYRPQLLRDDSTHSKLSVPLSSQSNEADDEQSLSDPSYDMESTIDAPHYEGEDTRLTSDKELSGFYMYGWAAEVCAILSPCPPKLHCPCAPSVPHASVVLASFIRVQASYSSVA